MTANAVDERGTAGKKGESYVDSDATRQHSFEKFNCSAAKLRGAIVTSETFLRPGIGAFGTREAQ